MDLLIFKTNVRFKKNLKVLEEAFSKQPAIANWTVDREDIDKVMRIELAGLLTEEEIIQLVTKLGLHCEVLED